MFRLFSLSFFYWVWFVGQLCLAASFSLAASKAPWCNFELIDLDKVNSVASVQLQFSGPVDNFSAREISTIRGSLSEFGNIQQALIYKFKIKPKFPRKKRITTSIVRLKHNKAFRLGSKALAKSCGKLRIKFKRPKKNKPKQKKPKKPKQQPTPAITPSPDPIPNASPAASITPNPSPSISPSPSSSASPRPSQSPSTTPSASPSQSPSLSPSASPSLSPSASPSPSLSPSPSPSSSPPPTPSPSPSPAQTCQRQFSLSTSQLAIFPGAEGYGTKTYAGSGRNLATPCTAIYRVTNLNDSGSGSLRDCIDGSGPRTCIFEVGGLIWATKELRVTNPYLTIAGQTAPSPGVVIRGSGISVEASDVLVQHIRFRVGDDPRASCCSSNSCSAQQAPFCTQDPGSRDGARIWARSGDVRRVVFDHVSISWALDEGVSIVPDQGDIEEVTFSNSIIGSGLDESIHPQASNPNDLGHSKAVLISGNREVKKLSFHKNLLAHNADRNIRISTPITMEYVNNVIYDWGRGGAAGRTMELTNSDSAKHIIDIVGNLYVPGLDTFCPETQYQPSRCFQSNSSGIDSASYRRKIHYLMRVGSGVSSGLTSQSRYYLYDNLTNTRNEGEDEWNVADKRLFTSSSRTALVFPANKASSSVAASSSLVVLPATVAYSQVLIDAGAYPSNRDSVDQTLTSDVSNGTGRIINCVAANGTTRCNKNAGGWPSYTSSYRALNVPANPFDDDDQNGYSNLEDWLFTF